MTDLIQIRRDTAENWASVNPTLALGEMGFIVGSTDGTHPTMSNPIRFKVGDGFVAWNDLPVQIAGGVTGSFTASNLVSVSGPGYLVDSKISSASIESRISTVSSNLSSEITSTNAKLAIITGSVSASLLALDNSKAEKNGYYVDMTVGTAEALEGSAGRIEDSWTPIIRTTGGDLDILSDEPVYVLDVRGATDVSTNSLDPMTISAIRFNGFNALDPTQYFTGTVSGDTVTTGGSTKVAYFRCVKGTWGTYGESVENNGYLFTSASGEKVTPVAVKECMVIPTSSGATLYTVPTTVYNNYTYYLPGTASGYLCAQFAASQNLSEICAHIAWSNKDDDMFVVRAADTLDLTSVVTAIGNTGSDGKYGLHGISNGTDSVADEIVFNTTTSATRYKRCQRVALASLPYTASSKTDESGSTTYTYSTVLSPAANYSGLFTSSFGGIVFNDGYLSYTTTTYSTVADLQTAMSGTYLIYGLATTASSVVSLTGAHTGNDMGTEEVIGVKKEGLGTIRTSYMQGLTDYLRGLRSDLILDQKVLAQALTEQYEEIRNLKAIVTSLSAFLTPGMISGQDIFLMGSGSPVVTQGIPTQPWLFYRDAYASPSTVWVSAGNDSTADWIQIG